MQGKLLITYLMPCISCMVIHSHLPGGHKALDQVVCRAPFPALLKAD